LLWGEPGLRWVGGCGWCFPTALAVRCPTGPCKQEAAKSSAASYAACTELSHTLSGPGQKLNPSPRTGWGCVFQNGTRQYSRAKPESNRIDVSAAGDEAARCGVNLVFRWVWGLISASFAEVVRHFSAPLWSCALGQRRFFKMGQGDYFSVDGGEICIDVSAAGDEATCCGVNLAFAGLGVVVGVSEFCIPSRAGKVDPFKEPGC
jgi:hypothetical protein